MSRPLRLYSNPITSTLKPLAKSGSSQEEHNPRLRYIASRVTRIPMNVSPISHVIIPNTTGLNPNAHLTPLKGYYIRYKGKIQEKTLRSSSFKFRTGTTKKSDYRAFHYDEGYTVSGPYGALGIYVYYEYDLENYFTDTDVWIPKQQIHESIQKNLNEKKKHTTEFVDENEGDFENNARNEFDKKESMSTQEQFKMVDEKF